MDTETAKLWIEAGFYAGVGASIGSAICFLFAYLVGRIIGIFIVHIYKKEYGTLETDSVGQSD